jgi:hypothetical protein
MESACLVDFVKMYEWTELGRWEERTTMLPTEENPSVLHESPKGPRLSPEQGRKAVKREV